MMKNDNEGDAPEGADQEEPPTCCKFKPIG